jgi:hypothetical protein
MQAHLEVAMEHKTLSELAVTGHVASTLPLRRDERLCRWAAALEQLGPVPLNTLWRTEFTLRQVRPSSRADNSPLTVAYNDPVLRAAGLKDDSYGEAMRFFEISDRQLHWLVCFCRHGQSILADTAARCVRTIASGQRSWFARLFA